MKRLNFIQTVVTAGILLGLLTPSPLAAAPPADAPLPLPSVIFYGVARLSGEVLAAGTVKVALPRGGMFSVPIGPVAGTGYNYVLSLPLGMAASGTAVQDPNTAALGDTIRFYLNGTLAVFRDQTGLTRAALTIPADAVGKPYVLDLALVGPEAYPLGDVNANGVRDSADSLLVLRYDVGLTSGGSIFPPGPRTIYLPLCDIVSDGRCNSSDALRILQCDAGMSGVVCPPASSGVSMLAAPAAITQTAPVVLRTDFSAEPEAGLVTVRVLADDPLRKLGAASLDLHYDTAGMSVQACTGDPDGLLDAAFCNSAYLTGTVRMNAVAVQATGTRPVLAAVSFRLADPSVAVVPSALQQLLSRALTLTVQAVFDSEGEPLLWRVEGPRPQHTRIYLPLLTRAWGDGPSAPGVSATPSATPAPTASATPSATALPTPSATPTASATSTPSATPTLTPTLVPTASPTATPSALPTNTPTIAPVPSATSTPTPTPLPAATPSATSTPTPTLLPAATPSATSTPTPAPVPPATPTATPSALPTNTPTLMQAPSATSTPTPSPAPVQTSTPTATPAGGASTGRARSAAMAAPASGPQEPVCRV